MTLTSPRHPWQGNQGGPRRTAGFTLIELMIAVAIIGILASIAYPSYTRYVEKARRTDAMSALTSVAGRLERCYTVSSDYTDDGSGGDCATFPIDSEERFYKITATTLTATKFKLEASPQDAQASDDCGNFSLNHQGVRGADETDCW